MRRVDKHGYGVYDVENDEYDFVDLPNPKPFLAFKLTSIDDLVNGTEKLVNELLMGFGVPKTIVLTKD